MTKNKAAYTLYLSSRTFLAHLAAAGIGLLIAVAGGVLLVPASMMIEITIIPAAVFLLCIFAGGLLFLLNGALFVLSFIYWVTHKLVITEQEVTLYTYRGKKVFARADLKSVRMRQESGRDIRHNRGVLSFRSDTAVQDFGLIDDELRVITILRQYVRDPTFAAVTELQRRRV